MDDYKNLDGIYDNKITACREVWKKGVFVSCYEKRLLGKSTAQLDIIRKEWGEYPLISVIREDWVRGDLG